MTEPRERDSLTIEVADFGPIVEARVDLRPLTVFVGPSNTGKSYLAILIYALHRFFGGPGRSTGLLPSRHYPIFEDHGTQEILRTFIDLLDEKTDLASNDANSVTESVVVLPSSLTHEVRTGLEAGVDVLGREIGRCFGIDKPGELVRRGQRNAAHIVLRHHISGERARFEHALALTPRKTELKTTIPQEMPIRIDGASVAQIREYLRPTDSEGDETGRQEFATRLALDILSDIIMPNIVDPVHVPAYYLPADRTGVMHAHSVVVSALIGRAPTAGLRPAARTPMLSGVLADFLGQLIEIDRPWRSRRTPGSDLGANIEKAVLGGTIRVDRSAVIDYPHFAYRPDGWKDDLPLMNASSMVSELAPVVLYLRHLIRPGDVLIIEEPESHLHPAMQVEFTRQLAALVNAGIRVIVTTHSEWLLEEVANIVRRSELSEADRRPGDVALRRDQVGAWLFQPKKRPRGSAVTEICLDDTGLYPSGFDEVAAALHNDWAEISSRIENVS